MLTALPGSVELGELLDPDAQIAECGLCDYREDKKKHQALLGYARDRENFADKGHAVQQPGCHGKPQHPVVSGHRGRNLVQNHQADNRKDDRAGGGDIIFAHMELHAEGVQSTYDQKIRQTARQRLK